MRAAIIDFLRTRVNGLTAFFFLSFFVSLSTLASQHSADLVDVKSVDSTFVLDIRYATKNNFTHQKLYRAARCLLRREVAESLSAVQHELAPQGLRLKIYDGYRPLSVQKKMWAIVPIDGYVANPAKGSRHNRGAAVDVTLIDAAGKELSMPTPFDDFTEKAHRRYMQLPKPVIAHRAKLEEAMKRHGFIPLSTEWWHFDFRGWRRFPIMDIPLQ